MRCLTHLVYGFSSVGRALVSKTRCREFESLNPCKRKRTKMSFLNKVGVAFRDSYTELTQKVSWPTRSELTNSAVVVMVASLIIAAVVLAMDKTFETALSNVYRAISGVKG